jgi:transcriptional regulator with XRE-family HTH domain
MKMKITKEWLLKNADRDEDLEVTAGFLSDDKLNAVYGSQKQEQQEDQLDNFESRLAALAQVVSIRRRNYGWTLEQLADKADFDLHDVVCVEKGVPVHLSVRTIHKLSEVLKLPHTGLLRLSGASKPRNDEINDRALKFIARSMSSTAVARMSYQEPIIWLSAPAPCTIPQKGIINSRPIISKFAFLTIITD